MKRETKKRSRFSAYFALFPIQVLLPEDDVTDSDTSFWFTDEDEFVACCETVGLYTADEQVLLMLQRHDALLGGYICFLFHNSLLLNHDLFTIIDIHALLCRLAAELAPIQRIPSLTPGPSPVGEGSSYSQR